MEATGASRLVQRLYEEGSVYIGEYVSDDDSSSRAVLTHSIKDLIEAGIKTPEDWPKYKNGAKKKDNGLLPVKHPAIPSWTLRIRTNANCTFEEFKTHVTAVLEHHFDNDEQLRVHGIRQTTSTFSLVGYKCGRRIQQADNEVSAEG
jgi:hypothetical protein